VNNAKERRKIPRIETQARRRPPIAGENTKPRGAEAQTTPKLEPVLFLSLAPAMYALNAGMLKPDACNKMIPGRTSVQVLAK